MNRHVIRWTAPSPLWSELLDRTAATGGFGEPTILRFATDSFMQDFLDQLATDPRRLGEFRAVRETWKGAQPAPVVERPSAAFRLPLQRQGNARRRSLGSGARPAEVGEATTQPVLKLYQPAHQRHYLLSACLVCQTPGLPDRRVESGRSEKVSFVVRRLFPSTDGLLWDEYAWVSDSKRPHWERVPRTPDGSPGRGVLANEERLPLFPAGCVEDDQRPRRIFSGVIPVGRREAYLAAQRFTAAPTSDLPDRTTVKTARKILLRQTVIEPWKALRAQMEQVRIASDPTNKVGSDDVPDGEPSFKAAREQSQVVSWLLLLDLAEFLEQHVKLLWPAVVSGSRPAAGPLREAYDVLQNTTLNATLKASLLTGIAPPPQVPANLREALALYGSGSGLNTTLKNQLENVDQPYDRADPSKRALWPNFLFPLADPTGTAPYPSVTPVPALSEAEQSDASSDSADELDELAAILTRALPEIPDSPQPEIPLAAQSPADPADALTGYFRLRCVYERPSCGPLHEDVVSEPTPPFEMAGFFDPDAPARPIRIGLPIDTTPAGLRKFNKNTAFVLSDTLCGQVNRMKKITFGDLVRSVLPWPLHKDLAVGDMTPCAKSGASFGTICSLSIPIITICALILLLIIVTLLDFIFRWLPFFMICFPVPGLKGKKPLVPSTP